MIDLNGLKLGVQFNRFPIAAVDRVAQLEFIDSKVILGGDFRGHFLDAAGAPVASWTGKRNFRCAVVENRNEIVICQPDSLTPYRGGDEVLTVLIDRKRCRSGRTVNVECHSIVIQNDRSRRHRLVGCNLKYDFGVRDRTNIAARVVYFRIASGPVGVTISQREVLDIWQVDDVHLECRAAHVVGRHKIFERLAHREERKFEAVLVFRHWDLLPLAVAKARMHECVRRVEALHVGFYPHGSTQADAIIAR